MLFQRRLGLLEWWTWGRGAWVFWSEGQGSTSEGWPAAGCYRVCFKDGPAVSENFLSPNRSSPGNTSLVWRPTPSLPKAKPCSAPAPRQHLGGSSLECASKKKRPGRGCQNTATPSSHEQRKLSLLHFKSILHLAFQKNAWWLSVCNSSHPQPFLLGCASGEVHPPPPHQAPSSASISSISGRLACLPCGMPKRAQGILAPVARVVTSCPNGGRILCHANLLCTDP